eukprot:1728835-Pyramimonas_sp.AAC.1
MLSECLGGGASGVRPVVEQREGSALDPRRSACACCGLRAAPMGAAQPGHRQSAGASQVVDEPHEGGVHAGTAAAGRNPV